MYLETIQPAFWPAALLRRTSVFAAGENLGAGRIYFARAFKIKRGSHGACPVGIGMTDPLRHRAVFKTVYSHGVDGKIALHSFGIKYGDFGVQ